MRFDPSVFKAYDVRGLYPSQINERLAEVIGRGFVAHLGARRIAVSRDMRLSLPRSRRRLHRGGADPGCRCRRHRADGYRPALLRRCP